MSIQRIASFILICLFALAISTVTAAAGHGGGGHGGGGHGGGGHGGGGHGGVAHGGGGHGGGVHGAGFSRSAPRYFTSHGHAGKPYHPSTIAHRSREHYTHRVTPNGGRATVHGRQTGSVVAKSSTVQHRGVRDHHNLVSESVRGVKNVSVIRNAALAAHLSREGETGRHGKLFNEASQKTHPGKWDQSFHGKFADKNWDHNWHRDWNKKWDHAHHNWHDKWHWRHHHPIVAAGWYGPLFWPYAYWDFVDYTFWPYAYDLFWPYAYDDIYVGIFGPYAYEGPAYAEAAPSSRRARRARQESAAAAVVCNAQAPALTDWPIQQIAETTKPDQTQQSALNDLKDATANTVNTLQSTCPDELPSTPTGRLEAMRQRIGTMLTALSIVQPPLQRFYDSLNDEQKARFNLMTAQDKEAGATGTNLDLSQVCGEQAVKGISPPIDRILQAVKPTDVQRTALDELNDATNKAADFLEANCSVDQTLTPPARVAAMEKRLNAMMEAIKIVQPALLNFYGSLTDEQKARFNQLGAAQGLSSS